MDMMVKKEKYEACCELSSETNEALMYLATFSNGKIEKAKSKDVRFAGYISSKDTPQKNYQACSNILVVETGLMQYCGSNKEELIKETNSNYQFLIGVRKKSTERMKFYQAMLIPCKPVIECSKLSNELDGQSFLEKVNSLAMDFGSKKKKLAIESNKRYAVRDGSNKKNIEEAIKDAVIKIEEHDKSATQVKLELDIIPPQNSKAMDVKDIYNLYDILTDNEYQLLNELSAFFTKATLADIQQWKTDATYCSFVCRFLEKNCGYISQHKANLLMYFNYMMILSKSGYKDFRRKDPVPQIPSPFKENLLEKFTSSTTDGQGRIVRSMPPKCKDKVMEYAMVLALILNSYVLDCTWLQIDYKANLPKLQKLAYALGCHVHTKKGEAGVSKLIELKLPLFNPSDLPSMKRGRKKS